MRGARRKLQSPSGTVVGVASIHQYPVVVRNVRRPLPKEVDLAAVGDRLQSADGQIDQVGLLPVGRNDWRGKWVVATWQSQN